MQGRNFIRKTDEKKQIIERRNTRQFVKLYKRIANDLINLTQKGNNIDFARTFANYQPDYIYLFRNIFQDVKQAGFGFEIRKQLNFNTRNIIEIKKSISIPEDEQEDVNELFDNEYTLLINNKTEELANNEFIQSEARYFENIYNKSIQQHNDFIQLIKGDLQEVNSNLGAFALLFGLSRQDVKRKRILEQKQKALTKKLQDLQSNRQKGALKQFKRSLEDKIPIRSQSNTEYATGQATSNIKELEYTAITSLAQARDSVKKIWWENTQFLGGSPRENHLALSGTTSQNGLFNLAGYNIPAPRDASLPISETARCRCEVEYKVT